jgi:hypothetical protein
MDFLLLHGLINMPEEDSEIDRLTRNKPFFKSIPPNVGRLCLSCGAASHSYVSWSYSLNVPDVCSVCQRPEIKALQPYICLSVF